MAQRKHKQRKPISTDKQVAALKADTRKYTVRLRAQRGLYVRVTPFGVKTFVAVARDPYGKQKWATLGGTELSIEEATPENAIETGRRALRRIKAGLPTFEPPPVMPDSFRAVAEKYLKRHVEKNGLRSEDEIKRILKIYIYPVWGDREFEGLRRSDVTNLLDMVEDASGPHQADSVLGVVRGLMNWQTGRVDDYDSPIAPHMRRVDPEARERDRVLNKDEIRAIWPVAEAGGVFGGILRFALLTAQRRAKIADLRWDDIEDGVWTIRTEKKEKGNADMLILPEAALAVVEEQTRVVGNPHVFAGRKGGHFKGFSAPKRAFDKKVGTLPGGGWTIHDLRRTARSLMSEAKVRPDIAERVMGHAIKGVAGVYDRHEYLEEKGEALRRLAGLVDTILNPPAENVVAIRKAREPRHA